MSARPVILFDGVCGLCNRSVDFVLARDRKDVFRFAALQSEAGARLLAERGVPAPEGDPDSILLVEGERVYDRSTAALRIAKRLPRWRLLYAFIVVPRPIRDAIYGFIARRRYRWFGKRDACRLPTPAEQPRFL